MTDLMDNLRHMGNKWYLSKDKAFQWLNHGYATVEEARAHARAFCDYEGVEECWIGFYQPGVIPTGLEMKCVEHFEKE